MLESIRVCPSCDSALSIPQRRFGTGRHANACALAGAIVGVAVWVAVSGGMSLGGATALGVLGAIIGGLVAWLAFPDPNGGS